MATPSKPSRAHAITYHTIVKRNGAVMTTKYLRTCTAPRHWAKRTESDAEFMEASAGPGSRLRLTEIARKYLEQWTGRARSGMFQIDWWVAHLGRNALSCVSSDATRRALDGHKVGRTLLRVDADHARRFISMEDGKCHSPATVKRMKAAFSDLHTFARRRGYTTRNPARHIAAPSEDHMRVRFLTDDERARVLTAVRASTWSKLYLLVLSAIMTGARKGDLRSEFWRLHR